MRSPTSLSRDLQIRSFNVIDTIFLAFSVTHLIFRGQAMMGYICQQCNLQYYYCFKVYFKQFKYVIIRLILRIKQKNKLINQMRCTKLDISRLYYVLKITTFVSFKNVTIPSHGTRDFKPLFFTKNLS